MDAKSLSILIIPHKDFPCDHAMLEAVYTQLLPARGYAISWLMRSHQFATNGEAFWNGTKVYVTPVPPRGVPPIVRRLLGMLRLWGQGQRLLSWVQLYASAYRLVLKNGFDFIQVRNSVSAALLAYFISRVHRSTTFVFQYTFPIPELVIADVSAGRTRFSTIDALIARLEIRLRRFLLARADLVIAISDEMRKHLIRGGATNDRIAVCPMATDCPPPPDPRRVQTLRDELGLNGARVIIHLGEITPERQLDFLVRVAERVKRRHPLVKWLFLGPDYDRESSLQRSAVDAGLAPDMLFVGRVPRREVPAYLALAELSVSPIPPIPMFWLSSPTKTIESLAAGCPVVGTEIPDQAAVLRASGGGVVVPFDEDGFAAGVVTLLDQPARAAEMGRLGRDYVYAHRTYTGLAGLLDTRYRALREQATIRSPEGDPASARGVRVSLRPPIARRARHAARMLMRQAQRRLTPARLEILTYHFVSDSRNPFHQDGHLVSTATFRDQLRWLKRRYEIVPLRSIPSLTPRTLRPYLAISFDDGYRCALEEAYPILEQERVPATLFLCPSVLDNRGLLWRDKVRYLISHGLHAKFIAFLESLPDRRYRFNSLTPDTFYAWSKRPEAIGDMSIQRDLDAFFTGEGISAADLAGRYRLFMAVQDVEPRPFLDFGNHSWSHPLMTALPFEEQRAEIDRANQFFIERGVESVGFALPFSPYNHLTLEACASLGVTMIFNIGRRSNPVRVSSAQDGPRVLHRRLAPEKPAALQEII